MVYSNTLFNSNQKAKSISRGALFSAITFHVQIALVSQTLFHLFFSNIIAYFIYNIFRNEI